MPRPACARTKVKMVGYATLITVAAVLGTVSAQLYSMDSTCPGPTTISTAYTAAIALTTKPTYAANMYCAVTVCSPIGQVALQLAWLSTATHDVLEASME